MFEVLVLLTTAASDPTESRLAAAISSAEVSNTSCNCARLVGLAPKIDLYDGRTTERQDRKKGRKTKGKVD